MTAELIWRLRCGQCGDLTGSIERDDGRLWLLIHGQESGRFDDPTPDPREPGNDNDWPISWWCPHCKWEMLLDRQALADALNGDLPLSGE